MRSRNLEIILIGMAVVAVGSLGGCAKRVDGPHPVTSPPAAAPTLQGNIIEHTVQPGEDLSSLADDYYGDPGKAGAIAVANGLEPGARLAPGAVVKLRFDDDQWQEALRRARALTPYNEGVDLFTAGRYAAAEERFVQALDIAPQLHAARYNLALVLLKRGKAEAALVHLDRLVEARPQEADFGFARGNALFMTSRFGPAAAQYHALLDDDPGNKRAAFGYARSLQEAGDRAGARAAWRAYLELDGDSGWAAAARRNLEALDHGD